MKRKIFNILISSPLKWVGFLLLLNIFMLSGLKQVSTKFGPEVWYKQDDPLMKQYRFFEQEFGRDDTIILSIHHPNGVLNPESIKLVKDLTEKFYFIHNVIQVDSLANFNWIHSKNDTIEIEPIFGNDETELTKKFVKERAKIVMEHPELPGALISKDKTTTFIIGYIKPSFGKKINFKKIVEEAKKIVSPYQESQYEIRVLGTSYLTDTIQRVSSGDLKLLLPLLFAIIAFLLYFIFRSIQVVIISFSILAMTNIITFGISGFFGFSFSNITFTIPIILLAICIADAVHLLSSYYTSYQEGRDIKESLKDAYKKNLKPTLMTSLTTAIGFFSLASSNSTPIIEMGLVSGLGVLVAWLTTYALIAPLLLILPEINISTNYVLSDHFWKKLSRFIFKNKWPITLSFVLLTIFSFQYALKNKVDLNPFDQFSRKSEIWQTNHFIKEKIGGINGPEIIIDSGVGEGAKDPDFLNKVEKLSKWTEELDEVNKVSTIIDYLKQMNKTLHNDQTFYYKIPDSSNGVAESLLLMSMDSHQADLIKSKISTDKRYIRMTVLWNVYYSQKGLIVIDKILSKAKSLGLNVKVSGKQSLSINMINYIFATFKSSLGLSLIIITLVITLSLSSIRMGFFSLIPNILPLLVGAAYIFLGGYFIDFSCVVAFVISLGIAVDDTIHFLVAYKEFEKKHTVEESLYLVFKKCGNGIVLTTMILILGFFALTFSEFLVNYKIGILTVIVLSTALIADLLFLPALLSVLKTKFSLGFLRKKLR